MFSGKTTELIRRMKRYQIAKYNCLILRYAKDVRYSTTGIATHDKQELPAVSAEKLTAVKKYTHDVNVIGIDEGQFFPDCVDFAEEMANAGKIVIVAALDGDFQRLGFGDILRLIPLAESVVKLKAVCMACFNDASFTKRTTLEKELEVIGGEDKYMAVCRSCHHSVTTMTPSKFPLSESTNRMKTPSKVEEHVKVKRDLMDSMDVENCYYA
ncbi:Thymidine kinase, cytosolic [Frankliniella fusca]|uniref:Thymidine kinase n=1 Tax=Frankliniella fusca TaxID=407009 RepID=A0AAE1L7I8_9NEOP|nr:Thymidine kinase, cytosolic [Frankliniella fusca]